MEKRKVVNYRQLPTRVPAVIWTGIILWLFLDRLKVQEWVWGVVATVWVIILVATVASSTSEVSANVRFRDEE